MAFDESVGAPSTVPEMCRTNAIVDEFPNIESMSSWLDGKVAKPSMPEVV